MIRSEAGIRLASHILGSIRWIVTSVILRPSGRRFEPNASSLVGDSWGETLGANYIAEHPNQCAKAIFGGPGAIDLGDIPLAAYEDAPVTRAAEAWFAETYSQPRYRSMGDINNADVVSLYRSVPERELDLEFDKFIQSSMWFVVCDPAKLPTDEPIHGMGWWSNLMTSVDFNQRHRNPIRVLARTRIPVLILRGGCDYLRWEVAYQYKSAFPNSILLYVPDAGHAFGYDQPRIYFSAVKAFLLDRRLPFPGYTKSVAPPRVTSKAQVADRK